MPLFPLPPISRVGILAKSQLRAATPHLIEIGEAAAIGREVIGLAMRASQPRAEIMGRALVHWVDGVLRNRLDETERESAAVLDLIASIGAKRFEGQMLGVLALVALRRGDRDSARDRAERALAIGAQHGMGQIGPWLHGVRALIETDRDARRRWLAEGERLLGLGCVSHNHLQLPELAIDALLEIDDFDGVERFCDHLRSYTASDPLPLANFVLARGRALADVGRGDRSDALRAQLAQLRAQGERAELNSLLPAIDAALERMAPIAGR